jgi:hypothetical protein
MPIRVLGAMEPSPLRPNAPVANLGTMKRESTERKESTAKKGSTERKEKSLACISGVTTHGT